VLKVLMAALVAAAIAVPAAAAKNPHDQTGPSAPVTTIVSGPTPDVGRSAPAGGLTAVAPAGVAATTADCGACIVSCWSGLTRTGPTDWTGHVYIYQHLNWCGNGAQVTQASVWQSYDQYGWYHLDSTYGPWWSGGCVGCGSIRASGYILWSWTSALISFNGGGTTWLNSTMTAWGGISV
jgi:hypothetical protein